MKKLLLVFLVANLCACNVMQQPPKGPQIYTTPGSPGGVDYSHVEVTPL